MKKNYLFPHQFRMVGWALVIAAVAAYVACRIWFPDWRFYIPALYYDSPFLEDKVEGFFVMADTGILTIVIPLLTIGLLFIGFSKEKIEDEFVKSVREQSLVWATYITAALFILATLMIHGFAYTYVPYLVFFVFLTLFIVKFKIALFRFNKGGAQ